MSAPISLDPVATPRPLAKPITVGIWRLTGLVHEGQWSTLYAAQPADALGSPRSDYVVKIAAAAVHEDPEPARQIRAEVAAGTAARHPHLAPILDAALDVSRPYVVMPRIEGRPLADLPRRESQPLPVVLWWTRQCAEALSTLHATGWVHGDISPRNLMVDARGHLTVIDFGFAQRVGNPPGAVFRGTPEFSSPERRALSAPWHGSADVFSLGVILQRLAAPHRELPTVLRNLVERMVSENPEERPEAAGLVDELLKLELRTLHLHIQPSPERRAA